MTMQFHNEDNLLHNTIDTILKGAIQGLCPRSCRLGHEPHHVEIQNSNQGNMSKMISCFVRGTHMLPEFDLFAEFNLPRECADYYVQRP